MTRHPWQFWIDVGGTFTDCLARQPDGSLLRAKVLSSGAVKGTVAPGSSASRLVDPAQRGDPEAFWVGSEMRLFDERGAIVGTSRVVGFDRDAGALSLEPALDNPPTPGQPYELHGGLDAPILAIRYLLGLRPNEPIPRVSVRLGTTRGTNALITRRGANTALVTTRGFGDVLAIGYQNRPRLFDLDIEKPPPLLARVVEIDERVASDGSVLVAPNADEIRAALLELRKENVESLAICLLNAYSNGEHELLVERIGHELAFAEISVSSRVAPMMKIVPRGDTTVVDAYLNPVLRSYVERLRGALSASKPGDLRLLTSAGGLVRAERFVGKDSILSGPAGGVVGFSRVAQGAGFQQAIGFDMGGTSTDVSRFDGRFEFEYETEKAGVRVAAPMLAIETVAAGGGSLCRFDGVKLVVGPDSAGADPGPACYGRGGPLAVTDANLQLGRILPEHFPFPLDRRAVERRFDEIAREVESAVGLRRTHEELADGFVRVANANMVRAIRAISTAKGYDVRDYVLVAFGGAAPQHACAVAAELGMRQILCHPDAGLLSARGIGLADVVRHRSTGVYRVLEPATLTDLTAVLDNLAEEARGEVLDEDVPPSRVEVTRWLDLRYRGVEAFLTVPLAGGESKSNGPPHDEATRLREWFEAEHRRLYGYLHEGRPLEIVTARVEAVGRSDTRLEPSPRAAAKAATPSATTTAWFGGRQSPTQVYLRGELEAGAVIAGPAIVVDVASTTVVDPGWKGEVLTGGELLMTPVATATTTSAATGSTGIAARGRGTETADPVLLEIFNNRFVSIAEQMGITLRNTAGSVNVKERLDFSCALFTPSGDLVAGALHIPVHLGAMSETVRRVKADNPRIEPGDAFLINDPYRGGSHLPDLTVVTPVHDGASGDLLFFTACRAHHAEIGGAAPGSMPPFSRTLGEEGVLIANFRVVAAGRSRLDELRTLLVSGPYPTRNVDDNLADVAAQIAANRRGARELLALVERHSLAVVQAYMRHVREAAERKTRAALARLPDGCRRFTDYLDDGSPIAVAVTIDGDRATIDFSGTGPVLSGNLNANRAIVTAAVMYCLRLLIDEDIPLNEGMLTPVDIVLPLCLLNPPEGRSPEESPAVAGGNVETSQRVVDVLLGALQLAAASQGTMNNLLFGDERVGYYETICGGAGATPRRDGADAVHTHMTNTRLTDPEVLERRYPVRVREFSVRRGSGGAAKHRGGDGVVRRIEFLRPLEVSIVSQRRGPYPPYGMEGGAPGALGVSRLDRADGSSEILPAIVQFRAEAGDVLTIASPGGGGWGKT